MEQRGEEEEEEKRKVRMKDSLALLKVSDVRSNDVKCVTQTKYHEIFHCDVYTMWHIEYKIITMHILSSFEVPMRRTPIPHVAKQN